MDLVIIIHLALKACQALATQGTSQGFKPNVRRRSINDNKCLLWQHEDSVLPQNFNPVALLFKDEGGFSLAFLELSSSKGVWPVRKCGKGREK